MNLTDGARRSLGEDMSDPWPPPKVPLTPAQLNRLHNQEIVIGIVLGGVVFLGVIIWALISMH